MEPEPSEQTSALVAEHIKITAKLAKAREDVMSRLELVEATSLAYRGAIYSIIRAHPNPKAVFEAFSDYIDIDLKDASPEFQKLVQDDLHKIQAQIVRAANLRGLSS